MAGSLLVPDHKEIVIGLVVVSGNTESSPAAQFPVKLVRSTVELGEKGAAKKFVVPGGPIVKVPVMPIGVMLMPGPKLLYTIVSARAPVAVTSKTANSRGNHRFQR